MRDDKRNNDELRQIKITKDYIKSADGSCLIEMGDTKVICTATIEDGVPRFLKGKGEGWITAEYGMLPASCSSRVMRESSKGKKTGRTHEIQRLIGRSMRMACDMNKISERTVWIDCDVIQADGGTRCASITGSFVALVLALDKLVQKKNIDSLPIKNVVSAVSVGVVDGEVLLDLAYSEDSRADVDMNFVMTDEGEFIEMQGTAESEPFSRDELEAMVNIAQKGLEDIAKIQKEVLDSVL